MSLHRECASAVQEIFNTKIHTSFDVLSLYPWYSFLQRYGNFLDQAPSFIPENKKLMIAGDRQTKMLPSPTEYS
jgi:hypothetical protein